MEDNKKPGFKDAFAEAIRYMGPALAASLSSQDPMAPFNAYTQAMDQKDKDDQAKINQQANIQKQLAAEQNMNLKLQNLLMRQRELAIKEQDADRRANSSGQLSDKQVERVAAFKEALRQIDQISSLKLPKEEMGVFQGRYNSWLQTAGFEVPKTFTETKVLTRSLLSNYVKAISGAQATDREREFLTGIVPQVTDSPEIFKRKLDTFRSIVQNSGEEFMRAVRSGQSLKRETLEKMMLSVPKEQVFNIDQLETNDLLKQFEQWESEAK